MILTRPRALLAALTLLAFWAPAARAASPPFNPVALTISATGLYRITWADLHARGIDWTGIPAASLAVTVGPGQTAVPREISSARVLDHRSILRFYAVRPQSRYTDRGVYWLRVDPSRAVPLQYVSGSPGGGAPLRVYLARFEEKARTVYDPSAGTDPWFYTTLTASGGPTRSSVRFSLPGLVQRGSAALSVTVWGVTTLTGQGPQHHLQVLINGRLAGDLTFSGALYRTLKASVPASTLHSTGNTLTFVLPGDVRNQYNLDSMDVQTFSVAYPHALAARGERLVAHLPAAHSVAVGNLPPGRATVWRVVKGVPAGLTGTRHRNGVLSFSASRSATYLIAGSRGWLRPLSIRVPPDPALLIEKHARMVIIAPDAFLSAVSPLAAYHSAHGVSTRVVRLQDIYDAYSGGVADPAAITVFLDVARRSLGTREALLAGGDTFDYRHYFQCGPSDCPSNPSDASFIPSLYVQNEGYGEIPSDQAFVAGDSYGGPPAVAIARIPATSVADMKTAVRKTLALLKRPAVAPRAVFAAGPEDPDFLTSSDALASLLPAGWTATRTYRGVSSEKEQRAALLSALAASPSIVSFVGHGNLEQWGKPPALLTVDDVPKLANNGPAFFFGWGCQNAYYVDPTDESLDARLLFSPHGATLTIGSTGLDDPGPQEALARDVMNEIFHGTSPTVGEAVLAAERELLGSDATAKPVIQSYEMFGDPALPLSPFRTAGKP